MVPEFPPAALALLIAIAAEDAVPAVLVLVVLVGAGRCSIEAAELTENDGE